MTFGDEHTIKIPPPQPTLTDILLWNLLRTLEADIYGSPRTNTLEDLTIP